MIDESIGPRHVLGIAGGVPRIAAELDEAADDADLGILVKRRHLSLEPVRMAEVVGIEPGDESAAGDAAAVFERRDQTTGGATLEADASVRETEGVDHRRSRVGRAVVDREQFPVRPRLDEQALDRRPQRPGRVPEGHHDRDGGVGIHGAERCAGPGSRSRMGSSAMIGLDAAIDRVGGVGSQRARGCRAIQSVGRSRRDCWILTPHSTGPTTRPWSVSGRQLGNQARAGRNPPNPGSPPVASRARSFNIPRRMEPRGFSGGRPCATRFSAA